MSAIQLAFTLRTSSNVKTVHLLGSWDNYKGQLPLSKDAAKAGGWKGTFRFQGSTLQAGQRYWYYVCRSRPLPSRSVIRRHHANVPTSISWTVTTSPMTPPSPSPKNPPLVDPSISSTSHAPAPVLPTLPLSPFPSVGSIASRPRSPRVVPCHPPRSPIPSPRNRTLPVASERPTIPLLQG